tara:strand:- start:238 stop:1158 length:921 start_codon:yes stop_codon:yes gene_type:complete
MNENILPKSVLGRTDLEITKLGFGTALRRKMSESEWQNLLSTVLDSNINFIDTANDYGANWGISAEDQIGKHISTRRSEFYLATKCGCAPGGGEHIWTKENVFRGLHESLLRLKTDYVDLMQYHNPTVEESQAEDLISVLQEMREQGKVRWLGISTTLPHLPFFLETGAFDSFQIPYSALEREHEDWISKSAKQGIGIIIRGGVAQGQPSGKTSERDKSLNRSLKWEIFDKANLKDLLDEGESPTTLILRYTLSNVYAHTNIVGTTRTDHLKENIKGILKGPLSKEIYTEMKHRLDLIGESPSKVL